MKEKVIKKAELEKLLAEFINSHELIAPVLQDEMVQFGRISDIKDILWSYSNSLRSLKEHFLTQSETLYSYSDDNKIKVPELKIRNRIIFGIRPCDASSLLLLDKAFLDEYYDIYYANNRKNTVIIGFACESVRETCFCTSFDEKGPNSAKGMDVLITNLGNDEYFVELVTDKGMSIFGKYGNDAADDHKKKKTDKSKEILKKLDVPKNFDSLFDSSNWEKESVKCLTCGICRFLCPTCYCFSLIDENKRKIKYWDACSFKTFTKEAAGTNPREKKAARFKQWYYHKFSFYKKIHNEYLCTGCGRCIMNCPIKIDCTETIKGISV